MNDNQTTTDPKVEAAKHIAIAHDLLVNGNFPGALAKDVYETRSFLAKLHADMLIDIEGKANEEGK